MNNQKFWIASISKEHVLKAKEWQILQVCHGKKAPLKRIQQGDYVVFYSSKHSMSDKKPLQHFTGIAKTIDNDIYQVTQFEGFEPFRRKVKFFVCEDVAIRPLIDELDFIENKQYWGFPFRYGLLEITQKDFQKIADTMLLQDM